MKKTMWIAIGALAVSVIAASAQTEVLSGNAVGYVKVDISNTFTVINMPFDDMGGGATMFTNTIGPQVMGVGAIVYRYSGVDWTSYPFDRGNWNNAANLSLKPGVGYFFKAATAGEGFIWSQRRPYTWPGTPLPASNGPF